MYLEKKNEEEIKEAGITLGMLRISIGIEDAQDIINDFEQALARIQV